MSFTKFYRKRLAILALISLCFLLSFVNSLFKQISDDSLDALSIDFQRRSSFNPRAITCELFAYIQSKSPSSSSSSSSSSPLSSSSLYSRAHKPHSLLDNTDGINFHWDDWVDLSPANSHLNKARKVQPDGMCSSSLSNFAQVNPYFMESYNTKVNRGMANLYCVKDTPKRVLVAADTGYYEIPVTGKKRIGEQLYSSVPSKEKLIDLLDLTSVPDHHSPSFAEIRYIEYKHLRKSVEISPQDFNFDIDKEILTLKEKFTALTISPEDIEHLKFLEASNAMVDQADRFFKYPWIYSDVVAGRSHHTSFPFFKRFISSKERQSVIQHMVRAWFQFSESSGVNSWVNYGSLLGWAYNGVNLPWDTDVDIQIPIAQLDKLSRRFNSTIITENPRDGNAKYLFEVSPTYIRQGNGRNFIDARFIEINTGLYIDISVLAHTEDQAPRSLFASLSDDEKLRSMPVHCKNWNWHLLEEILPIRHTYFEDSPVYIPNNISSILSRKYGQDSFTSKLSFNGHHYDESLQLWIPNKEDTSGCELVMKGGDIDALSNKCKSSWVRDEYKIVRQAAECHKRHDWNIDLSAAQDVEDYPKLSLTRKDAFDYFQDIIEKRALSAEWYNGQ